MKEFEQVYVESRAELRRWFAENHHRTESVWLVTFKKHVPEKYVSWDEIVCEAICFGWIDSLPRKLDKERSMLLLSPRRPGSPSRSGSPRPSSSCRRRSTSSHWRSRSRRGRRCRAGG